MRRRRILELVVLAAIVAVAAGLRMWALDSQPGGLYPDEAAEGYDAQRLLHQPGFHPVFFPDDGGREALYAYVVAIAFRVAGESIPVLRATSAIIGVLAVVAMYAWLRRRGPGVALGGAAWAAGSLWLVCVSRDGMRNILVPLAGVLALWAMAAWAERPTGQRAVVAGAAIGLGLWTYQPLKLLPVLMLAWLLWTRARDPERWGVMRPMLGRVVAAYLVVGAPMILTAVVHPANYFGRAVTVTVVQHAGANGFLEHTLRTLLMFPLTGDPNARHDVAGLPLLGWPLTALAALGVVVAWRRRREPFFSLLLLSIPVFLVPPLVATADPAPHFLRSLGLAAPIAALVGHGCAEAARLAQRRVPAQLPAGALGALLVALMVGSGVAYFGRPVSARFDAYSFNLLQLARAARSPGLDVVLLDDYDATDVRFVDAAEVERGSVQVVDPGPGAALPARRPGQECAVLARSPGDISRAYGDALATGASAVAFDPAGHPSAWLSACP
ncbi:MAG: ArnT family glycosyltransferase [Candidatus Dormibacteria bacterium]